MQTNREKMEKKTDKELMKQIVDRDTSAFKILIIVFLSIFFKANYQRQHYGLRCNKAGLLKPSAVLDSSLFYSFASGLLLLFVWRQF